jgi:hypothetical protein
LKPRRKEFQWVKLEMINKAFLKVMRSWFRMWDNTKCLLAGMPQFDLRKMFPGLGTMGFVPAVMKVQDGDARKEGAITWWIPDD